MPKQVKSDALGLCATSSSTDLRIALAPRFEDSPNMSEPAHLLPCVYAFDVDHTLEVSEGPVLVNALRELVEQGHVVGLCGNWAVFVRAVPEWHRLVSFLGPLGITKAEFLVQLRLYVPARDYVMVGNDPKTGRGASPDRSAAGQAGWRFIVEQDFADGVR